MIEEKVHNLNIIKKLTMRKISSTMLNYKKPAYFSTDILLQKTKQAYLVD